MHKEIVRNLQIFNFEGLQGRLKSSSYFPKRGRLCEDLIEQLKKLFCKYGNDGLINFLYETNIFWS